MTAPPPEPHAAEAPHNSITPFRAWYETNAPGDLVLHGRCLACNREQGERMCDLCQRLEDAEAGAA